MVKSIKSDVFLVSSPLLAGSFFDETVIYLSSYSPEKGAIGFIINKRLIQPTFSDILIQFNINIDKEASYPSLPVMQGGPVDSVKGFVIYPFTNEQQKEKIIVNPNLNILREIAQGQGPSVAFMTLGYCSWKAGQLEDEIIEKHSWFLAPFNEKILFSIENTTKWSKVLDSIGVSSEMMITDSGIC